MDFSLTDEQLMIRESAEGLLADLSDSAAVRAAMAGETGHDPEVWRQVAEEMAWPAVHVPEACGGLGLGAVELAILMEQMGRRLFCSPFLATSCLASVALLCAGEGPWRERWLPAIAEGRLTATLAFGGTQPWGAETIDVVAEPDGEGYRLSGTCRQVLDLTTAGLLLVAARLPDSRGERGVCLFAVDPGAVGVTRTALPGMDQTRRLGRLELSAVTLGAEARIGDEGEAWPALEQGLRIAAIALAAEQLGGAQQCLEMTVAYGLERQQFGRPIGGFQAIKHRAADMMLAIERTRSAVYYAACVASEALDPRGDAAVAAELPLAASLAKAQASETYFHCAAEALQLHGGVGFTWEYDPHLYFKRARAGEGFLGTPDWHHERIARQLMGEAS